MATYIPDATQYTEPTDDKKASTMGLEFRTLKEYIQLTILAGLNTNTADIATKVNRAGDVMTGNLVVAPVGTNAVLGVKRDLKASGYAALAIDGGSDGYVWNIFQDINSNALDINSTVTGSVVAKFLENGNFRSMYNIQAANYLMGEQFTSTVALIGFNNNNGPRIEVYGTSSAGVGNLQFHRPDGSLSAHQNNAGVWTFVQSIIGNITGQAASALSVLWANVVGHPTHLSQFINDIGAGGAGITSFQGRTTAAAVLISSDVTGALGYTPYNSSNPSGYQTASGTIASAYNVIPGGNVNTGTVTASGLVKGNGSGGNGLGTITVSTSGPSGGSDGDIWFQY